MAQLTFVDGDVLTASQVNTYLAGEGGAPPSAHCDRPGAGRAAPGVVLAQRRLTVGVGRWLETQSE